MSLLHLINPMKLYIWFLVISTAIFFVASTLSGKDVVVSLLILKPRAEFNSLITFLVS